MLLTPLSILGAWFRGMLAVALLAAAGLMLYEWHKRLPRERVVVTHTEGQGDSTTEVHELRGFRERLAAWRPNLDTTTALLLGSLGLLGVSFGGGLLLSPRSFRRGGADEPQEMRTGEHRRIKRPDGTELHIELYGPTNAQPIVLTHGWGCDSTQWYYLKRQLSERYRLVVWDLPGLGQSTRATSNDYSLGRMASDLRAVVESNCDRPAILLGHSIGGMIILTLCQRFQDMLGNQIAGLIIVNSTPTNPLKTMLLGKLWMALQKPLIEPLCYLTIGLSPWVWLTNCLSYLNGSAHWSTEFQSFARTETRGQLDFATRYLVKTSPAVAARGSLAMLHYDATDILAQIEIPVLVVAGDCDPVTKPEASRQIKQAVRDGHLFIMKPSKHLALLEHNEEFSRIVNNFCAGVAKAHATSGHVNEGKDLSMQVQVNTDSHIRGSEELTRRIEADIA
jgi:pimeloyl-ACP methyl ester carboxylesterase